jgi:hypothetical protein
MIKSLYYAYASSDTARLLGFSATGCYYLCLESDKNGIQDKHASTDYNAALNSGHTYSGYEWGKWSLYQPPKA